MTPQLRKLINEYALLLFDLVVAPDSFKVKLYEKGYSIEYVNDATEAFRAHLEHILFRGESLAPAKLEAFLTAAQAIQAK